MCKETNGCKCNGKCNGKCSGTCRCKKEEPLVIGFENEVTGEVERYKFIEEFEFNSQKIMAITSVDGCGIIQFVVNSENEDEEYGEFICDKEVEEYFRNLHKDDENYMFGYVMNLISQDGDKEELFIIDQFDYDGNEIYVVYVETDEDGYTIVDFVKRINDKQYVFVVDDDEKEKLLSIFIKK